MAYKISFANKKGGISKTSSATACQSVLRSLGKKVLLIDTDPQRDSSTIFGAKSEGVATLYDIMVSGFSAEECIQHTENGDVIACDALLDNADTMIPPSPKMYKYIQKAVREIEDNYDYIIFDTPPKPGIMLGNALEASDGIVIPVTCDMLGTKGLNDFYQIIQEYQEDNSSLKILGILIVKYKGRETLTANIENTVLPNLAKKMNTIVFNTRIREGADCRKAQALQMSLMDFNSKCNVALDYQSFSQELLALTEKEARYGCHC